MIISHKHKFIFLKTRKTAGTSIEISLSRYCGKNDVITPISPKDEKIRNKSGVYPKNYFFPFVKYNVRNYLRLIIKRKRKIRFWNHAPATYVKEQIGEKIWNSYYKFCFERNPWDKTVSLYYWRSKSRAENSTFEEFLNSDEFKELPHYNFPIYTENNNVIVDYIGRYENHHSYYDLTGVNPNPINQKENGILRYKKKWGGKMTSFNRLILK